MHFILAIKKPQIGFCRYPPSFLQAAQDQFVILQIANPASVQPRDSVRQQRRDLA
jgi:hypothetical protein